LAKAWPWNAVGQKAGHRRHAQQIGASGAGRGALCRYRSFFGESLTIRREVVDKWGMAASLAGLAAVLDFALVGLMK